MPNTNETSQERAEIRKNRDRYLERMKGRYPDRSFDDDEALFEQTNADYDDYENQLKGYKDRETAFANMFTSDPRSARLVMGMKDGKSVPVELIRLYGNDIREALDDPEKQEEIAAAEREYMERVAKEKGYEEEYSKNLDETKATLDGLVESGRYTDEQIDQAFAAIMTIVRDAIVGKFTEEAIAMALNAANHDADVETASQEGEARGRNARITEQLRQSQRGDGLPTSGSKTVAQNNNPADEDIFDLASRA